MLAPKTPIALFDSVGLLLGWLRAHNLHDELGSVIGRVAGDGTLSSAKAQVLGRVRASTLLDMSGRLVAA